MWASQNFAASRLISYDSVPTAMSYHSVKCYHSVAEYFTNFKLSKCGSTFILGSGLKEGKCPKSNVTNTIVFTACSRQFLQETQTDLSWIIYRSHDCIHSSFHQRCVWQHVNLESCKTSQASWTPPQGLPPSQLSTHTKFSQSTYQDSVIGARVGAAPPCDDMQLVKPPSHP